MALESDPEEDALRPLSPLTLPRSFSKLKDQNNNVRTPRTPGRSDTQLIIDPTGAPPQLGLTPFPRLL